MYIHLSYLCIVLFFYFQRCNNTIRDLESKVQTGISHQNAVNKDQHESLKRSHEDQTKEVKILRKTVDEMELRLETQKQTLVARDESIKKLLEMLQSKGVAIERIEESQKELEKCRVEKVEDTKKLESMKQEIEANNAEIASLKDVSEGYLMFTNGKLNPSSLPVHV